MELLNEILNGDNPTPFHAIDNPLVNQLCEIIKIQHDFLHGTCGKKNEIDKAFDMPIGV